MAEKMFNTRIRLKYDTHTNWTTKNPVLLEGEVAITTIPAAQGDVKQVPSILMKVGDGTNRYNDLKFVSGLAANVSNWALQPNKPTYTANEINGLAEYINGEIKDTNTTYQIVKINEYNYKLQSKELNGSWADVPNGTIVIPKYDDTTIKTDITALQTLVGETAVAEQISNAINALNLSNTYELKGAANTALSNAKAYTDKLANGKVKANTDAIAVLNGNGDGSVSKQITDAIARVVAGAPEDLDTLKEIADYIASDKTSAAELSNKVAANTAAIGVASAGGKPATGLHADIEAVEANIATIEGKVTTLENTAHTHNNKTLLDTYTQTEANLASAVANKHNHANMAILNNINAKQISSWDNAVTDVNNLKPRVTTLESNALLVGDTLILNCGNSAI